MRNMLKEDNILNSRFGKKTISSAGWLFRPADG